jgi:hypothetical protein
MNKPKNFKLKLIDELNPTDDGRSFLPGVITWPAEEDMPLPLMFLDKMSHDGHDDAQVAGYINKIYRENNSIFGEGTFAPGEYGDYLSEQVTAGLQGVSSDLRNTDSIITTSATGKSIQVFTQGIIRGATVLPIPAFSNTRIAVVASAIPVAPPKDWFDDPKLEEPTMITITPEGRIFGHVAAWNSCHIGYLNKCVSPPRSQNNYASFNSRPVTTEEGEDVLAGPLTFGIGHASLTASSRKAKEHYDNVNAQIGQIRVGEDAHGIWMAGAINPDVDDIKLRKLKSSAVSGDWRGQDLQGVLTVNIPGFPVPRVQAHIKQDKQFALVAAGVLMDNIEQGDSFDMDEEKVIEQKELVLDNIIAEFGATLEALSESDVDSDVAVKSKELLDTLTASVAAEPASEDSEGVTPVVDKTSERLDAMEHALIQLGEAVYKKNVN